MESAAPARSGPPRLVQREVGVESALSHWSQLLKLESAWSPRRLGLESAIFVGVSVESARSHWSQRGVSLFLSESGWSQAFPAGVSVGPARSQLLVARV